MVECPDCGGELVPETARTESRGTHKVFECNNCGQLFELTEVDAE